MLRMMMQDHNFQLAIIEALCQAGVFTYTNYPATLPEEQFDLVKKIRWSADAGLIAELAPDWDGEDDQFDINSLVGIEQLKNLELLHINVLLTDTAENRAIITQLQAQGVDVSINGQPGWPAKKEITKPLSIKPTSPIAPFFPPAKHELTLTPLAIDQLQTKLDQLIGTVFDIPIGQPILIKEPLSLGGFKDVAEAQGSKDKASYRSIVTRTYWSEQELHEASFYTRYLNGGQCLTITGSVQNTDQLSTVLVEANDIDPKIISQIIKVCFKISKNN